VREDWAAYLDTFTLMDQQVGLILDRLRREEIMDETVIFFTTDHGVSHARGKQFCYDEGIMVPLVIHAPGRLEGGQVRDELVAHIDIAATSLHFAGLELPGHLEARPLFGPQARPRAFVVSARDRCDETYDRIRSVRTAGWKFIRNGYPKRPHLQPCVYKDQKPIYQAIRAWAKDGKLNELQLELLLAPERAPEELYDLEADPWELNNLAADPAHAVRLAELRGMLDGWIEETGDRGQAVEPMEMYDSDMKLYIDTLRKRKGEAHAAAIERNVQLMKSWWAAGR
jgi:arylsulfatase A-like enzyme